MHTLPFDTPTVAPLHLSDVEVSTAVSVTFSCFSLASSVCRQGQRQLEAAVAFREPLEIGSKITVECRATVYGETEQGGWLAVLDSDTHPGVIAVPKDTPSESLLRTKQLFVQSRDG